MVARHSQRWMNKEAYTMKSSLRSIVRSVRQGRSLLISRIDRIAGSEPRYLNLGGGPWFAGVGWRNLEGVASLVNPQPFQFTSGCQFPAPNAVFDLVYSSHAFEHLDMGTVRRVLTEAHRVSKPDRPLLLKVPDYEKVLEAWRNQDESFFVERNWNFDSVVWSWAQRDIPDTIDYRASMIFCGFWTSDFGHHFTPGTRPKTGAYHGPAC